MADEIQPPGPPGNLTVIGAEEDSISLTWDSAVGGATGYEYRLDGGVPVSLPLSNSVVVTGLDPGTEYLIEVRAVRLSTWSEWVAVTASTLTLTQPSLMLGTEPFGGPFYVGSNPALRVYLGSDLIWGSPPV